MKRSRWPTALFVIVALILGFGMGALWMRQRHRSAEILFMVNGVSIDKNYLLHRLDTTSGTDVIHKLIEEELVLGFAKQKGLAPTEARVQARYNEEARDPNFQTMLHLARLTPDDVKQAIRVQLAQAALFGQGVEVSDQEVLAFYKANIDKKNPNAAYYTPEIVQIAVIVTKTEEQAKRALAKLEQGIPFATVAKTDSRDESRAHAGILSPIRRGVGEFGKVPHLEETLFALKIGQTTGPKKFADAWWIIRCLDRAPEKTRRFEEVKEDCRQAAMVLKGAALNKKKMEAEFTAYKNRAVIQSFRPEYEAVVRLDKS